jgi:hypothetical protein
MHAEAVQRHFYGGRREDEHIVKKMSSMAYYIWILDCGVLMCLRLFGLMLFATV